MFFLCILNLIKVVLLAIIFLLDRKIYRYDKGKLLWEVWNLITV